MFKHTKFMNHSTMIIFYNPMFYCEVSTCRQLHLKKNGSVSRHYKYLSKIKICHNLNSSKTRRLVVKIFFFCEYCDFKYVSLLTSTFDLIRMFSDILCNLGMIGMICTQCP